MQNKKNENDHSQKSVFCLFLSKIQSNTTSMMENQCAHLHTWLWPTHEDQTDICILMQNKSYQR